MSFDRISRGTKKMENIMLIKEGEVLLTTDTTPYKSIT